MALTKRSKKQHFNSVTRKKLHVKVGDTVIMLAGKDKGQTGRVLRVDLVSGKIVVEGLNKIKKAVKPNPMAGLQGGIIEMEAAVPSSKVMLYNTAAEKPTRIKKQVLPDGKKVRVCRKTGAQLD